MLIGNVLWSSLSVDSWSKNIVLSNEFIGSCSITQNECLDYSWESVMSELPGSFSSDTVYSNS